MKSIASQPIGVFDSGLGGLTIVKAIRKALPQEDIVYFGDLARVPYGIKSTTQIIAYSFQNARFLLKHRVKILVIACNSSSSAAHRQLKRSLSIPVIDVILPAAHEAVKVTTRYRIGVIATQATVDSGAYERTLKSLSPKAQIFSQACPLLVPLVEEGLLGGKISESIVAYYLSDLEKKDIDTLMLGCTHYPLLKEPIQRFLPHVRLVDSARATAETLSARLQHNKLRTQDSHKGRLTVYVSDKPRNFIKIGEQFLGERLGKVEVVRNEE